MKKVFLILLILSCDIIIVSTCQQSQPKGRIVVSDNGHYLQHENGTPFFWLGDTAWELFHRLTLEEIETYLDNRQAKGFNVIQAVLLAEMDGLQTLDRYGEMPLIDLDPAKPNEAFFKRVDQVIHMAKERQIIMALLPTWGDKVSKFWGIGPVVFNKENAYVYGKWLGERYSNNENIIWILGGDRPAVTDTTDARPIWRAMAQGILDGTRNKAIISYHTSGGPWTTSQQIHTEPWLHIDMMQSGHGSGHDVPVWKWIERDWRMEPAKPTLDSEPNYEDHPVDPWPTWNPANGYFRDYDVRKQTYRSVFSGACGVTYGHHSVWQFYSPKTEKINHADRYWTEALNRPGAFQVGYLKKLIESRPFGSGIPDQSIIVAGQGEKGEFICAFHDKNNTYLMAYLPVGRTVMIDASCIKKDQVNGWWFNPVNTETVSLGTLSNNQPLELTPPTLGFENDWVLILDDPDCKYSKPSVVK